MQSRSCYARQNIIHHATARDATYLRRVAPVQELEPFREKSALHYPKTRREKALLRLLDCHFWDLGAACYSQQVGFPSEAG